MTKGTAITLSPQQLTRGEQECKRLVLECRRRLEVVPRAEVRRGGTNDSLYVAAGRPCHGLAHRFSTFVVFHDRQVALKNKLRLRYSRLIPTRVWYPKTCAQAFCFRSGAEDLERLLYGILVAPSVPASDETEFWW